MIRMGKIYGLFLFVFVLTYFADTVSGRRCYDMTCRAGYNWWKKKCEPTSQPGQKEGECDYGRYCLKAVGTTRDGLPISYHRCSFKCEPDVKMSFGRMELTQYCCDNGDYCNQGDKNKVTVLSVLFLAISMIVLLWR